MNHEKVITCSCGETFTSENDFENHKEQEKRELFRDKSQEWIESNLEEPFASYHQSLMAQMGGFDAYNTCVEEDISQEPTDENVKEACLAWAQAALVPPNSDMLLDHN